MNVVTYLDLYDPDGILEIEAGADYAGIATIANYRLLKTGLYTIVCYFSGGGTDSYDLSFTRIARVDFNRDGQEDLLWRYYGEGGYNRAWFLGNSERAGRALPIVNRKWRLLPQEVDSSGIKSQGKTSERRETWD